MRASHGCSSAAKNVLNDLTAEMWNLDSGKLTVIVPAKSTRVGFLDGGKSIFTDGDGGITRVYRIIALDDVRALLSN